MADLIDKRLYKVIQFGNTYEGATLIKPGGSSYASFAGDFYESPTAALVSGSETLSNLKPGTDAYKNVEAATKDRVKKLTNHISKESAKYNAGFSFIHPYALIRLNGMDPNDASTTSAQIIDDAASKQKKWYETGISVTSDSSVDSSVRGIPFYAKNPTTGDLINWGNSDVRGRFPYMFQDFIFCKYWNKIENNRLITLRRYPAPVVDAVEPEVDSSSNQYAPFSPLSTMVTYFGEGTGNSLKELMSFSYKYNWEELKADVWQTTSSQLEDGNAINSSASWLSGGLGVITKALGIIDDLQGKDYIDSGDAVGLPPDPYSDGPYENRILGPVNVINNTYKRERGLTFTQDSLVVTFEYMSRPIAHVNNKAIMLDLLANVLAMTYASGTFFGGAHRYRCEHPAIYPWKDTNSLNKLYQGKLFGKEGAFHDILGSIFNSENKNWVLNIATGVIDAVKAVANDLINAVTGNVPSDDAKAKGNKAKENGQQIAQSFMDTAGRAMAAKFLKGQQAPWLQGARAILTGEPVGDWHLTIGNPLNPIATIGNLIVMDSKIEFSDELGPDDFPIGFKATITLQHGMGRDKDAIESMFNRGIGRIYILPDKFVSSADSETKVDSFTGKENNPFVDEFKADGKYGVLQTTGSYHVTGNTAELEIGKDTKASLPQYQATMRQLKVGDKDNPNGFSVVNKINTQPWAMHKIL